MVGLFWITSEAVYVGAPPTAFGGGVRLTSAGPEAVDPDGSRTWTWEELRSAVVEDVPTESPSGRVSKLVGSVISAAVAPSSARARPR